MLQAEERSNFLMESSNGFEQYNFEAYGLEDGDMSMDLETMISIIGEEPVKDSDPLQVGFGAILLEKCLNRLKFQFCCRWYTL